MICVITSNIYIVDQLSKPVVVCNGTKIVFPNMVRFQATKESKIELLIRKSSNAKHQLLKQQKVVLSAARLQYISTV